MFIVGMIHAQESSLPAQLPQEHPRYLTDSKGKAETQKLIRKEVWAKDIFEKLKQRTDIYADRGPE